MTQPTKRIWSYFGQVISIHDGDTFTVDLDLGLYMHRMKLPVRIAGINAPELADPSKAGTEALEFLQSLIKPGDIVKLDSMDGKFYEKYGRLLARPYTAAGMDIAAEMIANNHAVAYNPS